ncbi:porin [Porticoccaceae bacterium]|nr:porin [Porticoccaceae bacterium]
MKILTPLYVALAAGVVALPAVASGPLDGSIYGKINLSVVATDEQGGSSESDNYQLNSNASRLGVKGKSELKPDLYAVYKAEFEVCADDGKCAGDSPFKQRNIMAGIKGRYGMVWAGNHDTPTKMAQSKVDLFNDLDGDMKVLFEGENRSKNMVAYTSPTVNGFAATVAMMPGEEGEGEEARDGLADGVSYSLSYTQGDLYLAVAGDDDVDGQDLLRLVAKYQLDALQLGFIYQENEDVDGGESVDEEGYFVSAAYKLDGITLKAQFGSVESDLENSDKETLSLGADYKLAKSTKLFAYYTANEDGDTDSDYLGVGMEHKF